MAELTNKLTLDVSGFVKGAQSAKVTVDSLNASLLKTTDETSAYLSTLGGSFDKAFKDAKTRVFDLERAIAAMIASGKNSGEEFDALQKSLGEARAEVKRLDSALKAVEPPKIVPELGAFDKLKAQLTEANGKVDELKGKLKDALAAGDAKGVKAITQELIKAREEAAGLGDKVSDFGAKADKLTIGEGLKKSFGEAKDALKSGDISGALEGIKGSLGSLPPQAAAAVGAVTLVAGALSKGAAAAKAFASTQDEIASKTGMSAAEVEKLGTIAKDAYIAGVGGSAEEALKMVGDLAEVMGKGVPVEVLGDLSKKAAALGSTLGVDTPELIKNLGPAIQQFGGDADSVFNSLQIAAGAGVEDMKGLADAFTQFGPVAADAGMSAEAFGSRLALAAKSGVTDVKKIGEGYKDLSKNIASGDLAGQVANISGPVGRSLQELTQLAQTGKLSAEEFGTQYTKVLDDAVKNGQITANEQKKALTSAFGNVVEELGVKNTTVVFGAKFDQKQLDQQSKAAGEELSKGLGGANPLETLQRGFELFLQGAGKPIGELLDRISKAIGRIFTGSEDAAGGFEKFGEITGNIVVALLVNFESLINTVALVADGVRAAVDFVGNLFGSADETSAIEKQQAAAKAAYEERKKSEKDLKKEALELAKAGKLTTEETAKLAEKYKMSAEEAQKTIDASKEIATAVSDAALQVNALSASFSNAQSAATTGVTNSRQAIAGIEQEIAKAKKAGDKTTLDKLTTRRKELLDEAKLNVKTQRQLDRTLDAVTYTTDPAARKARAAAIEELKDQASKAEQLISANKIAETYTREKTVNEIERKFAIESLKNQIAGIDANTVAGRQQITDLQKQITQTEKEYAQKRIEIEGAEATRRFEIIKQAQQQRAEAIVAANNDLIARLQRNIAAGGFGDVEKLAGISAEAIKRETDAALKALVEATPEFKKAAEEIQFQLSKGIITDPAEAKNKLDELRAQLLESLTIGDEATTALGDQIAAILNDAQRKTADTISKIRSDAADALVAGMAIPTLKVLEEQVRALEKQRDVLLQNENLTNDARKLIEQGYAKAIDKVRNGSLNPLQATLQNVTDGLSSLVITVDNEDALKALDDVRKANEEVIAAFNEGKMSYQEALASLQQATELGFMDALASAGQQVLQTIADATQATLDATLQGIAQTRQELDKFAKDEAAVAKERAKQLDAISNDTLLGEEERTQKITQVKKASNQQIVAQSEEGKKALDKITTAQGAALEQLGVNAAAQFASLIANGASATEALKQIAFNTLDALVPILVAQITGISLASPESVLTGGTAGLVKAVALTALLKGIIAAAKSSFADGGFTGSGGKYEPAGIVHKGEFVAPQSMTKKHRGLLEHLYADKPLEQFPAIGKMLEANRISVMDEIGRATFRNTNNVTNYAAFDSGPIVAEIRSMRKQLEAMDTLQKTATSVVVSADKDAVIKQIRRDNIRNMRR